MCSNHFSEDFHARVHDMQKKRRFLKVFKRYERSELISKSKKFFFLKTIKAFFQNQRDFFKNKTKPSLTLQKYDDLKLQMSLTYNRVHTSFLIAMKACPSDLALF